ncbi:uncharacterized protein LOC117653669 [Thrips palmi]|uniref:Uncharacterized protein LOC117653669 n=1 Tax=Thrips palmi TaxID=161013 RepID=A0A6P9AB65_THRPL|nr:uncharacterized protein LOC117653669 [Thrips palmi]XP_034255367.1 uncharacterized protein LOC117653669 [Thrips palmi]XP_034255368.1 uncharacterized protein LOC117653669 [Thrips palmi]XP_034255369.1 uncharacterized protein LOC117653669 [Thrips palmi]XP_034255370.1 uncharacterized protein LOC117653669 [Thrips palmi]XP_034255371.1 uncharacterized protein LOC117653669 [Thrips palmi]XP_034255372.1 uncharacterized protein LOC117653669 [Thrips palmi]XP_034255373.1 uncharacterized protein LOC1176
MDQVALLALPDEVLLAVLAHLSPRELLGCRVQCRRLRDLCLHRRLWTAACVSDLGVLRAALSLAPCLRQVTVRASDLEAVACLVQGSACVVTMLRLDVLSPSDAALATIIVNKLSSVGGVRNLCLNIGCPSASPTLPTLLKAILCIQGIEELTVNHGHRVPLPAPWCEVPVRPSLTKLALSSRAGGPFMHQLLSTHAATLQDVSIPRLAEAEVPTALLGELPQLRRLACRATQSLSELADHPSLAQIQLFGGDVAFPDGARALLRRAPHLRALEFHGASGISSAADLRELAGSRSAPLLESLIGVGGAPEVLEQLAPLLPRFSSLQCLNLASAPPNLLRAISPESLPSLSTLSLTCPDQGTCLHAWLHDPAIQDLLLRNPRLHLLHCGLLDVPQGCACVWCRWGCHARLRSGWLYSAHPGACPRNCFQVAGPSRSSP